MQDPIFDSTKNYDRSDSKSFVAKLDPDLELKVNQILNRMPGHIKAAVDQKNYESNTYPLGGVLQSNSFLNNYPAKYDVDTRYNTAPFQPYTKPYESPVKEEKRQSLFESKPEQTLKELVPSYLIPVKKQPSLTQLEGNIASLRAYQEVLDRKVDDVLRRSQLISKSPQDQSFKGASPPNSFQSPARTFHSENGKISSRPGENLQRSEVKYRGSDYPYQQQRNPYGFLSPQTHSVQQYFGSNFGSDYNGRGGALNSNRTISPERGLEAAFREGLRKSQALSNRDGTGGKGRTFTSGFIDNNNPKNELFASLVQEKISGWEGFMNKSPRIQLNFNFDQKPRFVDEKYEDGAAYQGELLSGQRTGRGTYKYADGSKYEGEWEDSHKNGYGTQTLPNGESSYVGEWLKGKYHGTGSLYNELSAKLSDTFDYTNFTKLSNNWAKYEGEFDTGKWNGVGTLYLTNGEKYVGKFKNGKVHGLGAFYPKGGKEISGEWKDGKFTAAL